MYGVLRNFEKIKIFFLLFCFLFCFSNNRWCLNYTTSNELYSIISNFKFNFQIEPTIPSLVRFENKIVHNITNVFLNLI